MAVMATIAKGYEPALCLARGRRGLRGRRILAIITNSPSWSGHPGNGPNTRSWYRFSATGFLCLAQPAGMLQPSSTSCTVHYNPRTTG